MSLPFIKPLPEVSVSTPVSHRSIPENHVVRIFARTVQCSAVQCSEDLCALHLPMVSKTTFASAGGQTQCQVFCSRNTPIRIAMRASVNIHCQSVLSSHLWKEVLQ